MIAAALQQYDRTSLVMAGPVSSPGVNLVEYPRLKSAI